MVAETTTAGRRRLPSSGLGAWIGAPLLALLLMGLLAMALPESSCDESGDGDLAAYALFGFGIAVSVACLVGALQRLVRLFRRSGGIPRRQLLLALATIAILLVLTTVLPIGGNSVFYWRAWLVAVPATGFVLLVLVVAAILGRKVEDVGLLLCGYLAGAGLFVFPSLALLGGLIKSGGLCG